MIIINIKIKDANKEDVGKGIIQIDSDLKRELNINIDDVILISNPNN